MEGEKDNGVHLRVLSHLYAALEREYKMFGHSLRPHMYATVKTFDVN